MLLGGREDSAEKTLTLESDRPEVFSSPCPRCVPLGKLPNPAISHFPVYIVGSKPVTEQGPGRTGKMQRNGEVDRTCDGGGAGKWGRRDRTEFCQSDGTGSLIAEVLPPRRA